MIRTFKNIIHDIETFCDNHKQINEFKWGVLDEITCKDHKFVMLWLQPTGANIDGALITLNYSMYVFDIAKQDGSNLLDVINDTLLIGNDVIAKFWRDSDVEWTINEQGISCEPFDKKWDDFCAGWTFNISIELQNNLDECEIPD